MAARKDQDQEEEQQQDSTPLDPSIWDEQPAVTGRPNDLGSVTQEPALDNSTFASRAKTSSKAVDSGDAEDKSVRSARRKSSSS